MIDPRSVAFDFDSVVADTMHLFIKVARDVHQIDHLTYDGFTCYSLLECTDLDTDILDDIVDRLQEGRYLDELAPMPGVADVLQRLGRRYGPLTFVTARPFAEPVVEWLHQVLALAPETVTVVPTGSYDTKADELTGRGISFFVEDRLETCFQIQAAGVVPVLYKQPWNRRPHPFTEVDSWRDIDALIKW